MNDESEIKKKPVQLGHGVVWLLPDQKMKWNMRWRLPLNLCGIEFSLVFSLHYNL